MSAFPTVVIQGTYAPDDGTFEADPPLSATLSVEVGWDATPERVATVPCGKGQYRLVDAETVPAEALLGRELTEPEARRLEELATGEREQVGVDGWSVRWIGNELVARERFRGTLTYDRICEGVRGCVIRHARVGER